MDPPTRSTSYPSLWEVYVRSDGEYSDFPPSRVRENTPDRLSPPPPSHPTLKRPSERRRLSSSPDRQPSQLRHSPSQRRPKQGLRSKNTLNTIKVPKSSGSLKRGSETLDVLEEHPSKRKRIISISQEDKKWLKSEINGIKGSIGKIRASLRDMDNKLDEILYAMA